MSRRPWSVWIGFDPREAAAYAVARQSIRKWHKHVPIDGLVLSDLQEQGLYNRPTEYRLGKLWDTISEAHMSTEFAISRFLVPELMRREMGDRIKGWALFMDCDVLVRSSLRPLIDSLDDDKALCCVKHNHAPPEKTKMDGQEQTRYARKNWSSVMAFNCDHPSNLKLDLDMVNTLPGRDLHRFCWLEDDEIGEMEPTWNYLVGHTKTNENPRIVHMTDGIPTMHAYRNTEYAHEWFRELAQWAR